MFIGASANNNMDAGLVFVPNLARFSNRQSSGSEMVFARKNPVSSNLPPPQEKKSGL
jgi:hypothetical protein